MCVFFVTFAALLVAELVADVAVVVFLVDVRADDEDEDEEKEGSGTV
jgi:hypothetical protein